MKGTQETAVSLRAGAVLGTCNREAIATTVWDKTAHCSQRRFKQCKRVLQMDWCTVSGLVNAERVRLSAVAIR
jgi:hypothetical protein